MLNTDKNEEWKNVTVGQTDRNPATHEFRRLAKLKKEQWGERDAETIRIPLEWEGGNAVLNAVLGMLDFVISKSCDDEHAFLAALFLVVLDEMDPLIEDEWELTALGDGELARLIVEGHDLLLQQHPIGSMGAIQEQLYLSLRECAEKCIEGTRSMLGY